MKILNASRFFLALSITAVLVLAARNVSAQTSTTTSAAQPVPIQLSYGVSQIIELSKANVSEDTIVSFIQNSGSSYGLDASQIVYLKQQGVSDGVIGTMLNQHPQVVPAAPQQNYTVATVPAATLVAQPVVTCVQPAPVCVPVSTVYVIPDTQAYRHNSGYYNSYCGHYQGCSPYTYYNTGYPAVSLSVGFRSGNWGGYFRSGYRGGFRGGWHR